MSIIISVYALQKYTLISQNGSIAPYFAIFRGNKLLYKHFFTLRLLTCHYIAEGVFPNFKH